MMDRDRTGFTLVELLLFTGVISIMAGAIVSFSLISNNIAVHNEMVSEVEQNGDVVLQRIIRTVREGGRVAYPLSGSSATTLLLTSGNPEKEILFYLHGDRIAMAENGVATYLTTGNVTMDSLLFLHFGSPESSEGISISFRALNKKIGNEVQAGQYSKVFRGTTTLPPGGCARDADCSTNPFTTCCSGLCRPNCNTCLSHSDCAGGQVCCVESGTPTCKAAAACSTPQCLTVADCPGTEPTCDLATCDYKVATCTGNACSTITVGPCPSCSYCGDGRFDPLRGEECDDADGDNTDECLFSCRRASCGDGALQPLGANGTVGGGDDEQCDDGNAKDDDGCSATCQSENLCSGGGPNGTRTSDEECDDGNAIQTDTCDNFCRLTICGDGTMQDPNGHGQNEECDDGNTMTGDLCSPTCQTVNANECGNGIVEAGEECDDGKRCTSTGEPCQFDDDCPGASNLCRGSNIDGCTTPSACTATETPESTCNDAIDNDCDNLIDCADTVNCPNATSCGANGRQCSGGTCTCPGGEANEATCGDTVDNDCDGTVDCADSDCNGLTCDAGKTCQGGSCDPIGGGCGNEICENSESCDTCAEDCGACACSPTCPICSRSADSWSFVVSSLPADECSMSPGNYCNSYNGSFSLQLGLPAGTTCAEPSCAWCWESNSMALCGAAGTMWFLTYNSVTQQFELSAGGNDAFYTIAQANWDCDGNNILTFQSEADCIGGWPASITLTPSGSRTCASCNGDLTCDANEDCTCSDCEGQQALCAIGQVCAGGSCTTP